MSSEIAKEWFSKTNDCQVRLSRVVNPYGRVYSTLEFCIGGRWQGSHNDADGVTAAFVDLLCEDNDHTISKKTVGNGYFAPANGAIG